MGKQAGLIRRRLTPWLFLAPSLVGTVVFYGLPFLDVGKRSFQDAMGTRFAGLHNYRAVLDNEAFRLAVANTVRFLAICMPLLMLVSFVTASLLAAGAELKRKRADRSRGDRDTGIYGLFRTTLVLPMAVPAASMVLVWKIFLCPDGVLNQWLCGITGETWQVDWAFSRWAFPILVMTYLWRHVGYDMVLWLAGLQSIPGELYEAARMDGAGVLARLWYITLPELRGTFVIVAVLSVVNAFRVYREAYLLAGSYPDASIYLLPHLFAHWFLNLDIGKMTAAAVLLTGTLGLLAVLGIGICRFRANMAGKGGRRP